jgi:uncharacterized protein with PIN domain
VNAARATKILRDRKMTCVNITTDPKTQTTKMRCLHCGGEAVLTRQEDVNQRLHDHVHLVCPVTRDEST